MAKWRQRGCDSEVVLVVLGFIMLGEVVVYMKGEKIAENKCSLVLLSPTANQLKKYEST